MCPVCRLHSPVRLLAPGTRSEGTGVRKIPIWIAALLLLVVIAATPSPGQAIEARAAATMADLDRLSAETGLSVTQRSRRFLDILEPAFDLDTMAARALPPAYRSDPEFWPNYRRAYRAQLVQGHLRSLRYGPTRSRVLGTRRQTGGTVALVIEVDTDQRKRDVTWFTCGASDLRICDVETGGLRLATRQRETFERALQKYGRDGFLNALRRGDLLEPG